LSTSVPTKHILPLIVTSQFAGTSLWFAGNAILKDIQPNSDSAAIASITAMVQFGFISGTLVFALLTIVDRFKPSTVFLVSSLIAALANLSILWCFNDHFVLLILRFITGFFLAGIYPVGMKIAADWYEKGLGKALGWLVGSLVFGTAFPYLLKAGTLHLDWKWVIIFTSSIAALGGFLIYFFIGEGPYRKQGSSFHPKAIIQVFKSKDFKAAAFGYFGHMWELYAFWAFVPIIIEIYSSNTGVPINKLIWSFIIIGIGGLSCILGGYLSMKIGSARVAFYALLISGLCCSLSFIAFDFSKSLFLLFMLIWGIAATADSPQFSSLVAQTAIQENRGTAMTFVISVGFAITIGSIYLLNYFLKNISNHKYIFTILAIGPLLGLFSMRRLLRNK